MNTGKTIKRLMLLIPALLLLVLHSCKHNDLEIEKENENFRMATDFIKNNYDMTLFSAAIEKSGMAEQLNTAGPFTLMVPNDNAFKDLGINRPSDFDKMNPDSLKRLVQSHILTRRLLFKDVPHNGVDLRYKTLAGNEVYASVAGYQPGGEQFASNYLYFSGSSVMRKDIFLGNGVLHMMNKVIKYTPNITVQDWLDKRPQYSIFVTALKKFGYWDRLATAGPFTVYAPSNKVLEAKGMTEAVIAGLDPQKYNIPRLFGAYILSGNHFFLSDFNVFRVNVSEDLLVKKLENDAWYVCTNGTRDFFTGVMTGGVFLRTALTNYMDYPGAAARIPALSDNLTDNGIVHDLQGVVFSPEQALKNQ